ncbi:MAG: alpha-L-rhamnosidase C-terminal domain-containing protein [Planctomycetota bacterium]
MDRERLQQTNWLWSRKAVASTVNLYTQFRRSVELAEPVDQAIAYISADQEYQLFINGSYAARGPARGYAAHWPVDEVDLAPHLKPGVNVIAAIVHHPGISTFKYRTEAMPGFLFALDLGDQQLVSDKSWHVRFDPSRTQVTGKLCKQMGFQEQIDLRADDRSWLTCADAELSDDWADPQARVYGSPPWHDTEPRNLPMLTDHTMPYAGPVGHTTYTLPETDAKPEIIRPAAIHDQAIRDAEWTAIDAPASATGEVDTPAVEAGACYAVTIDLGRPSVGELLLEADGAAGGEAIDLLYSEAVSPAGQPLIPKTSFHRDIDIATRITLGAGPCRHEAFQTIGHRYTTLVVNGPAPAMSFELAHRETRYPLETVGQFTCNNDGLNQIYAVSVNTQRNCMMDAYVDTPWREQAQWWGDARVQAWNTFYLANDTRLLERGIRQIGDPDMELPNGLTYGHAPTIAHTCVLPDFACTWLMTLWDQYDQSGDASLFLEHWPRVDRLLKYFEAYGVADGGLVGADPRYWLFLDWTDGIPRKGKPALLNLLLLEALDAVVKLVKLTQPGGNSDRVEPMAKALRQTIDATYWDAERGRYRDGLDKDGSLIETCGLHTQVQAMLCGLRPESHDEFATGAIGPYLRGETEEVAEPTPYWMTYVYEAARRCGLAADAVEHMARHWAGMAEQGGTWERFLPPGNGATSGSHAWSAHPIYHLPRLLNGVVPTAPGWTEIEFEPAIETTLCDTASARVPTPHGIIDTDWKRVDGVTHVSLNLPPGIIASVRLPGIEQTGVVGEHTWTCEPVTAG